jgi:hypothetical protein
MHVRVAVVMVGAYLAVIAAACSDLREAPTAAGAPDAEVADARTEAGGETTDDGGARADAMTDGSSPEPGDPCDVGYPDGGTIDREWAMWPLPPADLSRTNYVVRDGVVCDRTTKLVWERSVGTARSWDDATTHCDTLSAGGYKDWRLPTRIELLSIVDYPSSPALEENAFPESLVQAKVDGGAAETRYWASTRHPTGSLFLRRFLVNFNFGQAYTDVKDQSLAVRCVRGGAPHNSTQGIAYVTTENTAMDPRTGLRWQRGQVTGSAVPWAVGLQECQSLQLDGFTGFRLPTIREVESLYDVRASTGPVWDKTVFTSNGTIAAASLWSSNEAGEYALLVSFVPGQSMYYAEKTSYAGARCVKGP